MSVVDRLAAAGIDLPRPAVPIASYVPWVRCGDLLHLSGQLPFRPDGSLISGKCGHDLSVQQGSEAARACAIMLLAQINMAIGTLETIDRIVKLGVYVNSSAEFLDHPKVANGASDLFEEIFGERGSYCSIVGLKPTYGLVPIRGIVPLAPSFDHCGPMTRTVEDAALLLTILAGYDQEDITSVEHPAEDYVAALGQPIDKLRLGIARRPFFDLLDPDIASAMEVAIATLERQMVPVGDVHLPDTVDFTSLGTAEIEAYHLELYRSCPTKYGLHFRNLLKSAFDATNDTSQQSAAEKLVSHVRASWQLQKMRRDAAHIFDRCDIMALPTMRKLPRPLNELIAREEKPTPREPEVVENCFPFNVLGLPAISVPAGFSKSGLPIGLMLAGPPFSEGRLLAVAQAFERSTAWHMRKPPLRPNMIVPSIDWRS